MATSDNEIRSSYTRYLLRVYSFNPTAIAALADQYSAMLQDGKTITSLSYEGASTTSTQTVNPAVLLGACEDALATLGVSSATRSASQSIFTRFSSQTAQT